MLDSLCYKTNIFMWLTGSPEGVDWSGIAQAALLQEEIMKNLESSIAQQVNRLSLVFLIFCAVTQKKVHSSALSCLVKYLLFLHFHEIQRENEFVFACFAEHRWAVQEGAKYEHKHGAARLRSQLLGLVKVQGTMPVWNSRRLQRRRREVGYTI